MMKWALVIVATLGLAVVIAWFAGPWLLRGKGDMAEPRSEVHAAELDGVIYVAGGIGFFRTLASCAAFDTGSKDFSACPDLPRALHHIALTAGEGQVFASGGYSSLPFILDAEAALFALDPSEMEPQWRELAKLPLPLGQHAMIYNDGAVWLVGGDRDGETVGALTRYDLSSGKWSQMAPMPTARHSHAVAMGDGSLYVTGGRSAQLGSQSHVVEAYYFEANGWSSLPDAPFDLGGHGAVFHKGRLHVFGGEDLNTGTVVRQHAWLDVANPTSGWQDGEDMPRGRHGFATARIGEQAWIIAGGKRAGLRTPWSVTGTAFALELR